MASEPTSEALLTRVQSFVADNKRAIVVGAAAAVAAGSVGYYLYSTRQLASSASTRSDLEKGGERKKKNRVPKKKKPVAKDGPILEERSKSPVSEAGDGDNAKLTKTEIEALPIDERVTRANQLKLRGNAAYTARKFTSAVELYTRAIDMSPDPEAVYFSNRAACYTNYSPPQHEFVVRDTDEALKRDPSYIKALNRRANALEALDRLEEALRDFTAATIFDKFQNDVSGASLERVLKRLAQNETHRILSTREPRLPSVSFILAYLAAFRPHPIPTLPESPSQGDSTLLLAFEALDAKSYPHSYTLVNEAIEQGISWDLGKAEAFNLRGTFKFLTGDSPGARDDFRAAIDAVPSLIQAWVKVASVYMEMGDTDAAFAAFDSAISHDPINADIYYHRGQVNFILQQYKDAEADYNKSITLDSTFVFGHIQLAVAQYKTEQTGASMATFRRTMRAFPKRSEPLNYYGELLMDQQRFGDAIEKFDAAIAIEKTNTPPNVVSIVNKAMTIYQWQQDLAAAERLLTEALELDPDCDPAVATLAQLYLQQGKLEEAVAMFGRHAEIARTDQELEQALTFKYATAAQVGFLKDFPHMASQLGQLARSLQQ